MKELLAYIVLMLAPLSAHSQQAATPNTAGATPAQTDTAKPKKEWYEFVFFSPLVSGVVVTGLIGWFLTRRGEALRTNNTIIVEQSKRHLDSLKAYQEEACSLQAPALETYNRLCKLRAEAPRIDDNKLLIEHLVYVLDSYSRFRVAYTESFRVSTQRYCPAVADAFDYISDDFCNIMIYVSSDLETRRSSERQEQIRLGVERLKHNIDCIETNLVNLTASESTVA